jgi:antitoxin Phd
LREAGAKAPAFLRASITKIEVAHPGPTPTVIDISRYLTSLLTSLEIMMRQWPVQDAKARFSEMLEASLDQGPQLVSKRGTPTAVLVSVAEWENLQQRAKRSLKDVLLAPEARIDLDIPDRRGWRQRDIPDFE